jgi:hypothetical protein|tara:strand:+ start:764 stop:1060 length:297 start_codon:yes stop_codon:yes gene_type:complete
MNHYAIFIQSYSSYLNGALFHQNGKAGAQFLVPQLARAWRQVTADVFRSRDNENETAYNRFVEQYQTLESIREHLRLDRQQCELEYAKQQKFDHYGEV